MHFTCGFARREFLARASCFGAFYALAMRIPLPALAAELADDPRISQTPLVDKGFAAVRKIGNGLYATISDYSKGTTTVCNGGFLVGKDAALLLEGFTTPTGAAFQMDALRMVSQVPVKAALDTHYHFDHSLGNSFYGVNNIPLWAHSSAAKRIVESYSPMQGADKEAVLAPLEKTVKDAKSDAQRAHAQSDLGAVTIVFQVASSSVLSLPNHPLDPAKLPMSIDLGGLTAVLESHPGHSGTDVIARVPAENVVYTGDLLFSGWYPVCFDEKATICRMARHAQEICLLRQRQSVCSRPRPALRPGRRCLPARSVRRYCRPSRKNVQSRCSRRGSTASLCCP